MLIKSNKTLEKFTRKTKVMNEKDLQEEATAKVVLGMTVSLDGYINDSNGSVESLYPNMQEMRESILVQEAIQNTGAVVMGRKAYDMADGDFTGYEFQTPIFVITHNPPRQAAKGENDKLKFIFITDGVESAISQAKAAAKNKDVHVIGGASTFQQILNAGLLDELQLRIMPVVLNGGKRLFENIDTTGLKIEKAKLLEASSRTDLIFNVTKVDKGKSIR